MQSTDDDDSSGEVSRRYRREYSNESVDSQDHDFEGADVELEDQLEPLEDVSKRMSTELRQRSRKGMGLEPQERSDLEILMDGKRSSTVDLETGKEGGTRSQCALVREDFEREPQSRRRRGLRKIVKVILKPFRPKKKAPPNTRTRTKKMNGNRQISRRTISVPMGDDTQYQIRSIDEYKGKGLSSIYDDRQDSGWLCGFSGEKLLTSYLFWAFRSSFLAVLVSAAVWFGWITFSFGGVLFGLAKMHPYCMSVAGEDFSGKFMDAYSLSWTTFTTVGYGAVFPGTSATADNINNCWGITIVSTLEAFVGILFASFWGAIFLSKVTRVSSSAQVMFCDPILIRFGEGVKHGHNDDEESSGDESHDESEIENTGSCEISPYYPCPVLEFRIINKLALQKKGEIIDASLNIVASVDSSQVASLVSGMEKKKKKGKKGKGRKTGGGGLSRLEGDYDKPSDVEMVKSRQKVRKILFESERTSRVIGAADPNDADKREFAKLFVESQDHPFFKRVWVARHVLDHDSPLLTHDAKTLIRIHGGRWPAELCNAAAVRACVNFDQILVSLSGTSNADANTVYAQKIYDYSNVVVGYRFCNMMYRNTDGSLGVDQQLLNDVLEQNGGGGEELDARTDGSSRKAKVDILLL